MIENSEDKKFIETDERNNPLMTLKTLKFYCQKQSLPSEPDLNQVLYLQYKGFQRIIPQTISFYINLKTLHLNNNGIRKIQGLHMLRQLNNLFLNNNFIEKIEGLDDLYNLKVLNLAHNKLDHVEGLDNLDNLKTLNLAQNFFTKGKDLEGLIGLKNLSELNLSNNQIQATQQVFQTITELETVTILYLKSTPLSNSLKNYRKRLISKLRRLKFLDNRPVLPADHLLAQAWAQGGAQKQTQLKTKILDSKRQEQSKQLEDQNKKGEEKLKQQNVANQSMRPIVYEKSDRPSDESGLDSAYLPKKSTKLQKFLEGNLASSPKKVVPQRNDKTEKQQTMKKVQEVLGNQKSAEQQEQQQVKLKRSIGKKWNKKYEKLLQQLLLKCKFDFSEVQPSFNMILANINKKLMKPFVRFQIVELRHIWTDIEIQRRASQQKARSQKSIKTQSAEPIEKQLSSINV